MFGVFGVIDETTLQRLHDFGDLVVVGQMDTTVVIGRIHEDLVDSAGLGHHVHGAEVMHRERIGAVEGREQVGYDAQAPRAAIVDLFEGRRCGLFVAGTERARPAGIDSTTWARGAKSWGLSARSATTVTHRPVRGFKRI